MSISPARSLDRRTAVAGLLAARASTIVVTGLGSATYDVAACGDHERNFYLWGAMGGAAMVGLGIALAQTDTPVAVITGDGEMLMGLGAFATIGVQAPRNLAIVVLDNSVYGETGAQASHTACTDLAAVARACGIRDTAVVRTAAELDALAARLHRVGDGPIVAVVKIAGGAAAKVIPVREGAYNKVRLRLALGLSAD